MARPIPEEERERIIAEFATGKSCNQIAREFGRSPGLVSRLAREVGHDFERSQTKKATRARVTYDRARRVALIDKGLAQQERILKDATTAHKMQAWWIGTGIALDKRREEDDGNSGGADAIRGLLSQMRRKRDGEARADAENDGVTGT